MRKKKEKKVEEIKEEIKAEEVKKEIKVDIPDVYILRVGETLNDVAKKFGISEEELKKLNNYSTFIGGNQIKLK